MPDEATPAPAAASETPTADALSGATPPAEAPAAESAEQTHVDGATPPPAALAKPDPAVVELARKMAQQQNLPEHQALREEKRKLKQSIKDFESTKGGFEQRIAALEAELNEATANPFAFAAKKRGLDEIAVYNERTRRAIDPHAAELDDIKKTLEREKEERRREKEELAARERQAYEARVEQTFANEVITIATSDKELRFLQLGLEEGEFKAENLAGEVLRRVRAAYAEAESEEEGSGKILDPKEVLQKIEKELREEAKRKAARLAKLEQAGQPASPDREGAVEPAAHEGNRSSGPRTLTNALASQSSGKARPLTRRERMLEADRRLRGG